MLETMQKEISQNLKKIDETGKVVTRDVIEVVWKNQVDAVV